KDVDVVKSIEKKIRQTIEDPAPLNFKNGGVIRKGFNSELDELIRYAVDSQKMIVDMEAREREQTGINSLKIRYNNVFGYYIEVTKTHSSKVPDHYKRKQTLTNAERYLTQELQELEEKVLSARSKRLELEEKIFSELVQMILHQLPPLLRMARIWALLDVYSSLAWLALERNYVEPQLNREGELELLSSRHPVVEQSVDRAFVANDICLKSDECLLLTGPNMAGKSTLMRQVALTSIMAQMGSFVPASCARLPLYEHIFTRIGASDYLSEGLSTFMVEMQETSEMLKQASSQSLVVLDEVGRGTSTYDGMSLAQAILEYLTTDIRCHTFFATHYHELTHIARQFPNIKNAHMSIKEENGEIQFLHTLVPGPANKSYGIQVAKLAGLPNKVTKRAAKVLAQLELDPQATNFAQMSLLDSVKDIPWEDHREDELKINPEQEKLLADIKSAPIQQMTPLDALNTIAAWQHRMKQ
ncbi:MAG: DNA mismatch repair protein MutS, partial [Bdellovibrionales bacterium]|nr:DNA mismatch repair protein MutS [Bdellovibrionales bacterium]